MAIITYGLIGNPLSHSGSESWFTKKLKNEGKAGCRYMNFLLSSLDEFPPIFRKYPALKGLNVTIPYKEKIIPWLEEFNQKPKKSAQSIPFLYTGKKEIFTLKASIPMPMVSFNLPTFQNTNKP